MKSSNVPNIIILTLGITKCSSLLESSVIVFPGFHLTEEHIAEISTPVSYTWHIRLQKTPVSVSVSNASLILESSHENVMMWARHIIEKGTDQNFKPSCQPVNVNISDLCRIFWTELSGWWNIETGFWADACGALTTWCSMHCSIHGSVNVKPAVFTAASVYVFISQVTVCC